MPSLMSIDWFDFAPGKIMREKLKKYSSYCRTMDWRERGDTTALVGL
jgi:hypothetical protein